MHFSLLAFVLFGFSLVAAGPVPLSERSSSAPGWSYIACVAEPTGGARVLTTKMSTSSTLTSGSCIATCTTAGYAFAGMEFGAECWCGNAPNTARILPDTSCSNYCSGDSSQKCGAPYIMSLWGKSSQISSTDYTSLGCYSDADVRTLPSKDFVAANMTPSLCQSTCTSAGFLYSGVENGNSCWCSSSLATGSKISDSRCSSSCTGSSSTTCGGPWAIAVSMRSLIPAVPTWSTMGCYLDDGVSRTLTGATFKDTAMTQAKCQKACGDAGFKYAGTEFSISCMCGNSLARSTQVASSQCNTACAGDLTTMCGGPYRLTLSTSGSV